MEIVPNSFIVSSSCLKTVKCPTPELEETCLLVEGKELNVDLARRLENGWRSPLYFSVVMQDGLGHRRHNVLAIRTETTK